MKKNILYGVAATAWLALTGCNGDYTDWVDPQANGPEAAAAKYGVRFAEGPEANVAMPDADGAVQLVQLSASSENVAGYTIKSITVNGEPVNATVEGNLITVPATELEQLVAKQNDSRAAVPRELKVETTVSVNLASGEALTIDAAGTTAGSFTPAPTPQIDPKGYYIMGDFHGIGWNPSDPHFMTDNGDGTYTITVNTKNEGDNWFNFFEGSHSSDNWDEVNKGQMGCLVNGDNALHGFVVYTGDPWGAVQTAVISGKGTFDVTLDMKNLTYTVRGAEPKYYVVGTIQGWSDQNREAMFYALGGNKYSYTTQWKGEYDLKIWDAKTFGNWDVAWGSTVDGATDMGGALVNVKAGAISAPSKGELWTLTIDMNNQSYTWTKRDNQAPATYASVSLIGDFNGWGGDIDLKQLADAPHNWYGRATIPGGGGLKFRANHDWATSWGTADKDTPIGDVYYLPPGGDNINVPAGTYDFYLNDITGQWNIVPVE